MPFAKLVYHFLSLYNTKLYKMQKKKIPFSLYSSFFFFLFSDENNSLSQTIPDKPIELHHFVKLCEQRRKFPVLYKLEFQVSKSN